MSRMRAAAFGATTAATTALACVLACVAVGCTSMRGAKAADEAVARARVLDQQGVRAYREERYNDAIRYFEEAFRLGGPPSELWNIAKCHVRLDEPDLAAKKLEEYLAQNGLSQGERREAQQQLEDLQHRHSTMTVASSPIGATVFLDGRHPVGATPATLDVGPGSHSLSIEKQGYEPYETRVEAKFGRAIIVEAQLSHGSSSSSGTPAGAGGASGAAGVAAEKDKAPSGKRGPHRVYLDGELGVLFPRYGSVGGSAGVAAFLSAGWVALDASRVVVTVGVRGTITGDSWSNTVGAPSTAAGCGAPVPNDLGGTSLSGFVAGGVAWRATPRLRIGGDLGLGFATFSSSQVGGDLFVTTCRPDTGVKPAVHLGAQASWAFSRELRLVVSPLILEGNPAFDGTRSAPKDASGTWLRLGAGLGLAFDVF